MVVAINSRGTLTLPAEIRKVLDIKDGDFFDIKIINGEIVLTPVLVVPKIKLANSGLKKEKVASTEIEQGKIKSFNTAEDLLKELNED